MQQYLASVFGDNKVVQVSVIVVITLLVVLLIYLGVRALFSGRVRSASTRNRQPRLAVVDAFDLDRQRQLVLVRRDHVEHLVMIGGPNDVVIETGIVRVQMPTRDKERAEKDIAFGQQSLPFAPEIKPQALPHEVHAPEPDMAPMPVHAPSPPPPASPVPAAPSPAAPSPAAPIIPAPIIPAPSLAKHEAPQAPTPVAHRAAMYKDTAPKVELHKEEAGPVRVEPPVNAEKISPAADMIEQLKALVPKESVQTEPVQKEQILKEPVDVPNPLAPPPRPVPPLAAPRALPPMPVRTPGLAPRPNFSLRPLTTPKPREPLKPLEPAKPLGLEPPKPVKSEPAAPDESATPKPEDAAPETAPTEGANPSPHPLDELEEQMARLLGRPVKLE